MVARLTERRGRSPVPRRRVSGRSPLATLERIVSRHLVTSPRALTGRSPLAALERIVSRPLVTSPPTLTGRSPLAALAPAGPVSLASSVLGHAGP